MTGQRFAIILTHNRPAELARCLEAIAPQVDAILVIDNASDPPVLFQDLSAAVLRGTCHSTIRLHHVPDQPPNLARLWNVGFDMVCAVSEAAGFQQWDIAVLCDDAVPPPGWFEAVSTSMRAKGAAIGASSPWVTSQGAIDVKREPDGDLMGRMPGWAFVIAGERGLRADESMHWWWLDTDLDWQARAAGGMVMIGGYPVPNDRPNDFTINVPGLAEQAGRDGETFARKWGSRPW